MLKSSVNNHKQGESGGKVHALRGDSTCDSEHNVPNKHMPFSEPSQRNVMKTTRNGKSAGDGKSRYCYRMLCLFVYNSSQNMFKHFTANCNAFCCSDRQLLCC